MFLFTDLRQVLVCGIVGFVAFAGISSASAQSGYGDLKWRRTSQPSSFQPASAQYSATIASQPRSGGVVENVRAAEPTLAAEPRRLPVDEYVRPVQAEMLPGPSETHSIQPGARSSQRAASPFDDSFPDVGQPRMLREVPAPSVMNRATPSPARSRVESLPPAQIMPEHIPSPVYEETGEEEWDGGHAEPGCSDCEYGQCDAHGVRHPHLYGIRKFLRGTLLFVVGGCDPCDEGTFGCDPIRPWGLCWDRDLSIYGGVQGYKNPLDGSSNFGFHEGVNWGGTFWHAAGIGMQFGGTALQTTADETTGTVTDHQQYFLTGGFYRRQMEECGWQYGAVYDHMMDNYYDDINLGQVRGELSYVVRGRELGFMVMKNTRTDTPDMPTRPGITTYSTMDQYAMFYRLRLFGNGEGRLWGGVNDDSQGIFGGDFRVPLNDGLALQTAFNYLSGGDDNTPRDNSEGWNVGVSLVFYPGMSSTAVGRSRYRPLFNVADNGTMMQRRD